MLFNNTIKCRKIHANIRQGCITEYGLNCLLADDKYIIDAIRYYILEFDDSLWIKHIKVKDDKVEIKLICDLIALYKLYEYLLFEHSDKLYNITY